MFEKVKPGPVFKNAHLIEPVSMARDRGASYREIAKEFNISLGLVQRLLKKRRFKFDTDM